MQDEGGEATTSRVDALFNAAKGAANILIFIGVEHYSFFFFLLGNLCCLTIQYNSRLRGRYQGVVVLESGCKFC